MAQNLKKNVIAQLRLTNKIDYSNSAIKFFILIAKHGNIFRRPIQLYRYLSTFISTKTNLIIAFLVIVILDWNKSTGSVTYLNITSFPDTSSKRTARI